jgi:prolipoprotein diacylglyceryl transferase
MLALGVLVALRIAERRYARAGHDPAELARIALWVVVAGVVGARVYHLFTGYDWDEDGIAGTVQIWEGGLSIWGAVGGGVLFLAVLARRHRYDTLALIDAIAPGLAVAQAIGRWGNWFNQELFGRPTDLPWALEIDPEHRPAGHPDDATFHPTFLYESLYCLAIFAVLTRLSARVALRRGQVFAAYVSLYTFGRFWFELLRVDPATRLFGVRFNALLSAALCVGGAVWFVWLGRRATVASTPDGAEAAEPDAAPG